MELIETVHKIFPYKSPYIDGCSAISSFPKHGLFMSTWGMENYLKANTPIMLDILKNKNPTFLFANIPSLDLSLSRENDFTAINYPLLEEDWETLKSNYVHHWSIIYVAGKQFDFSSGEKHRNFDILIEGSYTYEGEDTIVIDGALIEPYDIIKLERSIHTIEPQKTPSKATLRWGEHLYRPQKEPTSIPTFYGF
jgi:hypothetical protein